MQCLVPAQPVQRQRKRAAPCNLLHAARGAQALEDEKNKNLAMYAGRYQLFVAWSPDRSHPWDALPAAEQAAAVLEVGGAPDGSGKVSPTFLVTSTLRAPGTRCPRPSRPPLCWRSAARPTAASRCLPQRF